MTFRRLSEYFRKLEKTDSRLVMTRVLAQLFREARVGEIGKICYLSLGRLAPLYESLEFNLAEKMVMRAMAEAFGIKVEKVMVKFKKKGDLGMVTEELRGNGGGDKLSVSEVYESLRRVAEDKGEGSQERKVKGLAEIYTRLSGLGARYVSRMVVRKLRLGFSDKTMIDALSWMLKGDKSLRERIEAGYNVRADIGWLAREVKAANSIKGIKRVKPELGVPVMPALCQRLKTAQEMIDKMGKVMVEPKFDGTRVQIHLNGKEFLKTFTRNLDETTHMFPELRQAFKQIKAKSVILDSEAVGVDRRTRKLLSFQQTIVRKRKHGVEEASKQVPLRFFVFDVLYVDGKSLMEAGLRKRREILTKLIKGDGVLQLTEQVVTDDPQALRDYHTEQLKKGLEGVVVKQVDNPYISGRKGYSWVKFKEAEQSSGALADTLDCVVMGYYRGQGKRTSFGIGAFLVGVRQGEKLVTVAKIGTGLTDVQWRKMHRLGEREKTREKPKVYVVDKSLAPDRWVEPKIVVEIAADNITRSPNHSAKLALRFPRLKRFRNDKSVDQVTTVKEVKKLYELQHKSIKA